MTAIATRAPRAVESDPTLSVPVARGLAFLALAGFGALHWMVLIEPAASQRALYALGAGSLAMFGLLAAARLRGRVQLAVSLAVSLVALALALLGGGIADELLRPDNWGALASGIGRGIESLVGVRVPYRGLDIWTRTVISVGGTVLVVVAAIAAFWPRKRRTGFPGLALGLLVALYAVPAVSLDFENEFLRGAALALLVLAFLRLEKLRVGDASAAGLVAAGMAVVALMLAPALDRDTPWWDYERWALGAASARSTAFTWNHDYGPLDWPRDGRELLRVRAEKRPAYWKVVNLDAFDGLHWRQDTSREDDPGMPENPRALREGTQEISVTIRNLSSERYVTAGYTNFLEAPTIRETALGDGTWAAGRTLRRGDAYDALVYTPATNETERREAGDESLRPDLAEFRHLFLPGAGETTFQTGAPRYDFYFPPFADEFTAVEARTSTGTQPVSAKRALEVLEGGPYRQSWALAQQLREDAQGSQEDLVLSILSYLRRDFAYSETPPPAAQNLEGFLFDAKLGYCQQYSGAMALLLRMAGVPARVVTGFTSGSLDTKTREYVVRDLDAHSWVEVWYRDIGWVTFDPTPAAAPARSQPDEASGSGDLGSGSASPPSLGGDLPSDPGRRAAAPEPGPPWVLISLGAVAAVALAAGGWLLLRRRRRRAGTPPPALAVAELERALRRTRRHPGPGTTLNALEQLFSRSPAAAGYVRAVRELRYGGRPAAPTAAQRRGLRTELGRGTGFTGRLRAWWALPPRAG